MRVDLAAPERGSHEAAPGAGEVRKRLSAGQAVSGRVSVIIPVYQGEAFVEGAIASALGQTYGDVEVIVVDDGSTDGTATRLASRNDPRVTVVSQENQGLSAARNAALVRVTGEYVAFLDADDRWFPDKLAGDVETLEAGAEPAGFVYGWYYAVNDAGELLHRSRPYQFSGRVFDTMLATDDFILPSATLFHRRIFEEIGGFEVGQHHEDRVFFLRAAQRFAIRPTQRYSTVYRQSTTGLGRRTLGDYERSRKENLSIVAALEDLLSPDQIEALRAQQLRSLFFRFLMYGYDASAKRMLGDLDVPSLRHGAKGWIAWLYAKTGVNVMSSLRVVIQRTNLLQRSRWRAILERGGLRLDYGHGSLG